MEPSTSFPAGAESAGDSRGFKVEFREMSAEVLPQLKVLNSGLFPIKYADKMYHDSLACGGISQGAYIGGALVGAICCRLEQKPNGSVKMYIMTLGVLAPYRGAGIGTRLLQIALEEVTTYQDDAIDEAYLHVQSNNEVAIRLYQQQGFTVRAKVPNYYPRLNPPDAVLLGKVLVYPHMQAHHNVVPPPQNRVHC